MPGETEQKLVGARKNAVAVFEEFACAVQEFHNIEVNHDVINGDRVSKNAKIDRDFSDADQHVLTIGAVEGASTIAAISVPDSPSPSPLEAAAAALCDTGAASSSRSPAAEPTSQQIPPRSSRRGKLRARDLNASATPSQQQETAECGKRQRTAAAAGKKGGDGEAAAAPGSAQTDTLSWRGPVKSEPEPEADKENRPAPRSRGGRPPLPKRKKAGGAAASSSSPADGSAPPAADKAEPLRRSGRNPGLPPAPLPATRRTRSSSIISAGDSGGGGGASSNNDSSGQGDGGDGSSGVAEEIAELRAKKVSSMKVVDLKVELRKLGASVGGLKAVLAARLKETIDARISELESSLPLAAGEDHEEGDETEDAPEEEQEEPAPAPATAATGPENSGSARSDSPARLGRSSVAPGAALGPLTRLSMGRLSTESTVVTSPMRASPFFGEEATAVAAAPPPTATGSPLAAVAAAAAAGVVESAPQGTASAAPEDDGSVGGDGADHVMDVDSDRLESDDGSVDGDGREAETEAGVVESDQLEDASAAAAPGTPQGTAGTASAASVEEEEKGDDDQAPLSPPADDDAAAAVAEAAVAGTGDADGDVVPVADNVAEVIPEVALADVSGDMMDEEEEEQQEEEEEEGEVTGSAGARDDGLDLDGASAPAESGRTSGVAAVEPTESATAEALREGVSAPAPDGEDGATNEDPAAAVDDDMEVEEARCVSGGLCVRIGWHVFFGGGGAAMAML